MVSLLAKIVEMLAPVTEDSVAIMLAESALTVVMLILQKLGKFSMLFLFESDRDTKLVMPS